MVAPTKWMTLDGLTEGQTISVANINAGGSGDVMDSSIQGSGATAVARAAAAVRGTMGAEIVASGNSWWWFWNISNAATASGRAGLVIDAGQAAPSGASDLIVLRNAGGTASATMLMRTGLKAIRIVNSVGGVVTDLNGGADLAPGRYWLWLCTTKGTGSGDGTIKATLRNADDDTLITNFSTTTQNTGTTDLTSIRFGKPSSTSTVTHWLDEWAYYEGSDAEIDRPAIPASGPWTYKKFARFG